jgi:translation elongation factor EF-1beta
MGKVATVFKVYLEQGKENEIMKNISATLKPQAMQMEDIAFGIKVLKIMYVHEDTEGSTGYEEKLRKVAGVTEVEVAEESLL